jgi:N-acetyl-gamma-glutamyl-phosphate reductase
MQYHYHHDVCSLITATIIGASGYSGAELLRLLAPRKDVTLLHAAAATSAGKRIADAYPALEGAGDREYSSVARSLEDPVDIAFVALPSGEAMHIVPKLLRIAGRVIDLGGDFRLPVHLYEKYYGHPHTAPELVSEAVYGLPEINHDKIAHARLIANPGCYPTSIILALLPALRRGYISPENIVINALSGITGAGRTASTDFSFSEINENIRAYKIGTHQHVPEISTVLNVASGKEISFSFVPHLVPLNRGIYSTIHATLSSPITEAEIVSAYREFFPEDAFVRITCMIPQLKNVAGTNYCEINVRKHPTTNQLIIISVIDNLIKGAAGQAIQNMNIACGLPHYAGLREKETVHVA